MKRLKVREVEMINKYFAGEQAGDEAVVTARTAEDNRAETERRRRARMQLQAELEAGG